MNEDKRGGGGGNCKVKMNNSSCLLFEYRGDAVVAGWESESKGETEGKKQFKTCWACIETERQREGKKWRQRLRHKKAKKRKIFSFFLWLCEPYGLYILLQRLVAFSCVRGKNSCKSFRGLSFFFFFFFKKKKKKKPFLQSVSWQLRVCTHRGI